MFANIILHGWLLGLPILSILLQQKYEETKVNRYSPNVRQIHLLPEPIRNVHKEQICYEIGHTPRAICKLFVTRAVAGVLIHPCFSNILARTTFVLVSLAGGQKFWLGCYFGRISLCKSWAVAVQLFKL